MREINKVEVWGKIMSMIEPMEMVKIRFVEKWVSPADPTKKETKSALVE
jgi:hypothetical protein